LGQHFLVDRRVLARIVETVMALQPDRVVEMAAGAGALTFALAEAGIPVRALELDPRMVELLRAETADLDVRVETSDLAREDFVRFVGDDRLAFAGNLPYQVTSPVLFGLLPALARPQVSGAVVMIQAEVAERLAAPPGGRDYGILSVLLQARLHVRRVMRVRPGSFLPPPAVDSAVVELRPRPDAVDLGESGTQLVKELFAERRKQIGGLLRRRHGLDQGDLDGIEAETGIDVRRRAESLALEEFVELDGWLRRRCGE
jgi:16S rRNA (adenine1518-N6/adenine1519-N6)-dimethyltransferase